MPDFKINGRVLRDWPHSRRTWGVSYHVERDGRIISAGHDKGFRTKKAATDRLEDVLDELNEKHAGAK